MFVIALVLNNLQLKSISFHFVKVFLVKNLPVHLQRSDACILNLEAFLDLIRIGYNCWHGQGWRLSVVVEADLVGWDDDWTARNVDSDWELNWGKSLDVTHDVVVEFTADIVVNCDSDWDFSISW